MITAYEAKQLSVVGDDNINFILSKLEGEIIKTASKGDRKYICYQHVEWTSHQHSYRDPETTPIQAKVIERLRELGYTAKMSWHGSVYIPRGLADDDGNGPEHQNYVLIITW